MASNEEALKILMRARHHIIEWWRPDGSLPPAKSYELVEDIDNFIKSTNTASKAPIEQKDWRKMFTDIGGYENGIIGVPASGVMPMIEEIESLRKQVALSPPYTNEVTLSEREKFEAHYKSMNDGFCPGCYDGEYDWHDAQACWLTWQAAMQVRQVPDEMPIEIMRKIQMYTEIGAYICSNWANAYDCFNQLYKVMAAPLPPNQIAPSPKE